jgi:hypothetical protein
VPPKRRAAAEPHGVITRNDTGRFHAEYRFRVSSLGFMRGVKISGAVSRLADIWRRLLKGTVVRARSAGQSIGSSTQMHAIAPLPLRPAAPWPVSAAISQQHGELASANKLKFMT